MHEEGWSKRPMLLLDEPLLGLDEYLRDMGWSTVKGKPGMSDDDVINLAKANGYIVISPDKKLLSRCRLLGIRIVPVGLEDLARRVHEFLERDLAGK